MKRRCQTKPRKGLVRYEQVAQAWNKETRKTTSNIWTIAATRRQWKIFERDSQGHGENQPMPAKTLIGLDITAANSRIFHNEDGEDNFGFVHWKGETWTGILRLNQPHKFHFQPYTHHLGIQSMGHLIFQYFLIMLASLESSSFFCTPPIMQ